MNTRQQISLYLTSILMLVMTMTVSAKSIYNNIYKNEASSELLSKEEDVEKNITNVKVSFNPVASQISISFKVSKQSNVIIKLMDALGNELLNLSNSTLDSGSHNLSFETGDKISAGFYFVRITSGVEAVVKRISIR